MEQKVYDINIASGSRHQRLSFNEMNNTRLDRFDEDAVYFTRFQSKIFARKIERMDATATAIEFAIGPDTAGLYPV